jgi:chromate transporter
MSKRPTRLDLVILFAQVGMSAVGGQVAVHLWTRLVRRNGLNEQEYLEAMNWSQCVPGCNGTNLSAYLGWRFGRSLGAVLATIALLISCCAA